MEADFSGWVTKFGIKCADGRTIMHGAFDDMDGQTVPLVYNHAHADPGNVLGHVLLEKRKEGMWGYGFFNGSINGIAMKHAVQHKDVNMMSIYANQLVQRGNPGSLQVFHGIIREVSLVLAGANPGATIENITLAHGDGYETELDDEVIIKPGELIELKHSATAEDRPPDDEEDGDETIQHILDGMTPKQLGATAYLVDKALKGELDPDGESVQHSIGDDTDGDDDGDEGDDGDDTDGSSDDSDETDGENADDEGDDSDESDTDGDDADETDNDSQEGDSNMEKVKHSVFDQNDADNGESTKYVLSEADKKEIFHSAMSLGKMSEAIEAFCLKHNIDQIDILFPDAKNPDGDVPQFLKRRTEWVSNFLDATTKTPFARIKNVWADITEDEARAKGYIKGSLKKEEFFSVAKRVTTPTTIYKKQKLDRDDVLDITDFDVVAWLKMEMRIMLEEEIARAALIGDGRDIASEDKVNEQNIRPILNEHELFAVTIQVEMDDDDANFGAFIDQVIKSRVKYRGTGLPTMFTSENYIAKALLLKDGFGRDLYPSLDALATKLRVASIVPVEAMDELDDVIAIFVNPIDYTIGANRGGEVTLFDQFDIDYNQHKYLIETRCCGTLTKLHSALIFRKAEEGAVLLQPVAPEFDADTSTVAVPNVAHVTYRNAATNAGVSNSNIVLDENETVSIVAVAADGYFFASNDIDQWTFRGVATD